MYDEQFRKIRARTGRHWAFKHNELYCLLLMSCQHKSFTKIATRPKELNLLTILETKQVVDITSPFVTLGFQGTEPLEPAGYTTQARTAGGASMITSVGTAKALTHLSNAPGCRHTTAKPSNKKTVQTSPVPNPRIYNRNLPTPINPNKLGQLLVSANYPADLTKNLLEGFEAGFSLGFQRDRSSALQSKNLKSCDNLESVVDQKLEKEIAKDRISSGYATPPYPNLFCSPIGLVPKKVEGEFRLIHHLSHPKGRSVDGMMEFQRNLFQYHMQH